MKTKRTLKSRLPFIIILALILIPTAYWVIDDTLSQRRGNENRNCLRHLHTAADQMIESYFERGTRFSTSINRFYCPVDGCRYELHPTKDDVIRCPSHNMEWSLQSALQDYSR